jgi:hypothetical protein
MGRTFEMIGEGFTWTVKLFRNDICVDDGLTQRETLDLGAGWFTGVLRLGPQ